MNFDPYAFFEQLYAGLRLTTATLSQKGVKALQLLDCLSRNMSARRTKCISEEDSCVLFKESVSYQDDTTFGMFLERFVEAVLGQARNMQNEVLYASFNHLGYQIHDKNEKETSFSSGLTYLTVVKFNEAV